MIQNDLINSAPQNTNVIRISSSNHQIANRDSNSSQSSRLDRKNRFNVPIDQAYQQSLQSSSLNSKIQIQNSRISQSSQNSNINLKEEKKHSKNELYIKEDVANEASSICNSVYSKKEDQKQSQENNNPNKTKILYGNQVIQVRQSQQDIVEQMNNSMQSFHSRKSKDLNVYSAQDNKMLILEVKNPENIDKLRLKLEQDEKNQINHNNINQSSINVENKQKEHTKQKNDEISVKKETNNVLSCKICLEEGDSEKQGKLFTPCQCTGTCKWIHEECLKEWIISRYVHLKSSNNPRDFLKAECEICKYKYNMKFQTQQKFYKSNLCTPNGKKNFVTCLCSLLCILAYIVCMLFFLVINNSGSDSSNNSKNQNNNNQNQNNQNNSNTKQSNSSSSVQSYEYALIIVCSLLILLSLIVCLVSARQAFFRRSISKWIIYKYDPALNKVQNKKQKKSKQQGQDFNSNLQNQEQNHPSNSNENLRFYYNGQVFNTSLRNNNIPIQQQRYHVTRSNNPNRNNSLRREISTQDQSSQLFNIRNSDLVARQNPQNLIIIQNQNGAQSNIQNMENDESLSQQISGRQIQNNEIIRVDNNRNNININDESFEYFNNSQDMVVYQFNNDNMQRQSNFNPADNY